MPFSIMLTNYAAKDLEDIYQYIFSNDTPGRADYVLDQIEKVTNDLSLFPERSSYPKELLELGIREYREVYFKPYRLIYQIRKETVYIMLITDGRRDMQSLLSRRLLEA